LMFEMRYAGFKALESLQSFIIHGRHHLEAMR
jgi:hypothetical protein